MQILINFALELGWVSREVSISLSKEPSGMWGLTVGLDSGLTNG